MLPCESRKRRTWAAFVAGALAAAWLGPTGLARADLTFEVVKSFELPDSGPGELVRGGDGAFYGITAGGGAFGRGAIFRIDSHGAFTRLHSFDETEGGGSQSLVVGGDGALYGASQSGGESRRGSVYRIDAAGSFSVIHSFSGPDGIRPATPILGTDGALYGTTAAGGALNAGTVFRVTPDGTFTLLHSFATADASYSGTYLVRAGAGGVYGVINGGGFLVPGGFAFFPVAIFKLDASGTYRVVHSFAGEIADNPITAGGDGSLYGETRRWDGRSYGSLFKIDPSDGFGILYEFDADARFVGSPLFIAGDGTIYGRTELDAEAHSVGTIFKLDPSGSFQFLDRRPGGSFGRGPMVLGADGAIYATRFRIAPDGTVTDWPAAYGQSSVLVLGDDGAFYTSVGGYYDPDRHYPRSSLGRPSYGEIVRIDAAGVSTIHRFEATTGFLLRQVLAIGSDGAVYGATHEGGDSNAGILFRIGADRSYTELQSTSVRTLVTGSDGAIYGLTKGSGLFRIDRAGAFALLSDSPGGAVSSLVPAGDGAIYGAIYGSGSSLFRIDGGGLSLLPAPPMACEHGGDPVGSFSGPLTLGADGALHGLQTSLCYLGVEGFTVPDDRLFRLDAGGFSFVDLFPDSGLLIPWDSPDPNYDLLRSAVGRLVAGGDGALYGTTPSTIFRLDGSGSPTTVHEFSSGSSGPSLYSPLVLGAAGALYGTTYDSLFRVTLAGEFETVHTFDGSDGMNAMAPLTPGIDGSIYGTTSTGGENGAGTVFKVDRTGVFRSLLAYTQDYRTLTYDELRVLVAGEDSSLYGVAGGGQAGGGVVYRLFEPGHLTQRIRFDSLPDRTLGDEPFTVSVSSSAGLPVSLAASGSCSVAGALVTLTGPGPCTLTASQAGNTDFEPATDVSRQFDVLFAFDGFRRPIAAPPVLNQMKAGRAAKLVFVLDQDRGRNVLAPASPTVETVACDSSALRKRIDGVETKRKSGLRHRPNSRRYTYLWNTHERWAGTCRRVTLQLADGTTHEVLFELYARRPSH